MKFLITEPNLYKINPEFLDKHSFIELDFKNQSDFDSHLKNNNYDGIFTKIGLSLNKLNLNFQKSLNFVASPTTGLNHIDENYCLEKSIEILSLKDELNFLRTITTTAEHAWMLMLMCGRSPRKMLDNTSNFNWDRKGLEIIQFRKKTAGIIGLGRLGKILEEYCHAFKMNILFTDLDKDIKPTYKSTIRKNLSDLLVESDVIFLSASFDENKKRYILGKKEIGLMKKESILVNISRGELIDNEELLLSLQSGNIKAAGLDVLPKDYEWIGTEEDNLKMNNLYSSLVKQQNVYLTPHAGGYAFEAIKSTRQFILDKAMKYCEEKS